MNELSRREQSLVALGAAIASNCVPCVEYHIPGARRVGLSDDETELVSWLVELVRAGRTPEDLGREFELSL